MHLFEGVRRFIGAQRGKKLPALVSTTKSQIFLPISATRSNMRSNRPPEDFVLTVLDLPPVSLRLLGPSAQGWICATKNRDACYRLLPITGGDAGPRQCEYAPIERRQLYRDWMAGAPAAPSWVSHAGARHLAPVTDVGQGFSPALEQRQKSRNARSD